MSNQPSGVALFFGYAMIAVGILIMLLSGGCTLVAAYLGVTQNTGARTIVAMLMISLPVFAIGFGIFIGGRSLSQRRGPMEPPSELF